MNYYGLSLSLIILITVGCSHAIPQYASTIRPPAYPLAVRSPYTSFWLPADELPGHWPSFWAGATKGWLGLIRVDGVTYEWMGAASVQSGSPIQNVANQTASFITPTQTIFHLTAGPIDMIVTFFSPVEYQDIRKASIPLSYVLVDVESNDGQSHSVQLYMDITGEWGSSDNNAIVQWALSTTSRLKTWSTERQTPIQFGEWGQDYPQWGQGTLSTSLDASHASGSDVLLRAAFVANGSMDNSNDNNFRCVSCDWPTFAFVHDLGMINSANSASRQFVVGHVREFNINLLNVPQRALWVHYFVNVGNMLEFFYHDIDNALTTANALDIKVLNDAYNSQGQAYADIIALSLRQAYAGTEWSGNLTHPILYLKEISSNGNMQTVDVIYPTTPVFYYLNVKYLEYLLEPLWFQMETPGLWDKEFSMHDIGGNFPNASGQGYGGDMPVEESANMIFMVGNVVFHPSYPVQDAIAYIQKHYTTISKWANYLYYNCLYPIDQLTTDDFIGTTELNSGLALKGILAMSTFTKMSRLIGNVNNTEFYENATASYVETWFRESLHASGTHLKMEYNVTDPNTYQFKYNAFQDKLLSLNSVPTEVYDMEAAYYLSKAEEFGIPFVNRHDYTKSDWEMWTAAAFGGASPALRTNLVNGLAKFIRESESRVPFCDWYVTANGRQVGFQARPVAGGHFALLALNTPAAP